MRQRGASACGDNCFERLPGSALAAHPETYFGGKVKFHHTWAHQTYCFFHNFRADPGCIPDPVDLGWVFNRTKMVYQAIDGDPADALSRVLPQDGPIGKCES
jgi:hypothetical protein